MAAFYLDHNVALQVVRLLARAGHTAISTRSLGRQRADDDEQLLLAAQHRWIVATHNEDDFELLHKAWLRWSHAWNVSPTHAGVLILEHVPPPDIAQALLQLTIYGWPLTNHLYKWSKTRGWR